MENSKKGRKPQGILNLYEREYKDQQVKTSIMSGNKKGDWEKRKIIETKKDSKKFWSMIKELLGKNKDRDEEAYIYTEEGTRKNINEISDEYLKEWKKEIYQKTERVDLSFWYGKEDLKGKKKEMEEEELQGNSGIMKDQKCQRKN